MIARDAVHRMIYYLINEEYKESDKVTESLLIKCLLKGQSRKKTLKTGNPGGIIKMKHGNDPIWTSELFENPLVVLVTENKEIQTTSLKFQFKKGCFSYRFASNYEIKNEVFVWPDETSDAYKELKKDILVCDVKEKIDKVKKPIHNKIVEKFRSDNEKLVIMMEAATKSDEIIQFLEDLQSSTEEKFIDISVSLCGISQSQKAILSKMDQIDQKVRFLMGENNAMLDDKRRNGLTDSNKLDAWEHLDTPISSILKSYEKDLLPWKTVALKYYEDKLPIKNQTAAWVNEVNKFQSFENLLDPSVAHSVSSGDVSIDMEITDEVPKLEQNSFGTFESSLRSVYSDTHLLPNRNSEDQGENMVGF